MLPALANLLVKYQKAKITQKFIDSDNSSLKFISSSWKRLSASSIALNSSWKKIIVPINSSWKFG